MNRERINKLLNRVPTHVIVILTMIIWIVPTLGLLVTSLRPPEAVRNTGWWTVFTSQNASGPYVQYCAECHGADGKAIPQADLTNPELIAKFPRSLQLLAMLRKDINGQPHMGDHPLPSAQEAAEIAAYLKQGEQTRSQFTANNYIDALVGYRGENTYRADCAAGTQPPDLRCNLSDILNPRGMGRAFINSLLVTLPATFLPILFAAFAGYAFAWLDFKGRFLLFALLVGLQVVPLQMTLVPISRFYAQAGLNGTFLGVWLFHTGFGMPYAIYLMRNFLGTLPRDLFESAYLDGASHWTAFRQLVIPLATPAIASLGIFQFLWVWNDLLVALVFLGGTTPVMTYQISNMVTSLGSGWQVLTAAAFLSMLLPMIVFFSLQRYFVRGMLAGAVKGVKSEYNYMMDETLWYKDAVFYEVYVRAFYDSNSDGHGDLKGLTQKLDYVQELGVNCLWLLPIYPSPLKDDGYDISDYYGVHSTYGNLDDVRELLDAAHARGIRVIMDLVLNHTSDQHPWFQASRSDRDSPYRDYYVWSDTDQKYKDARIIFLDTEPSNWTWDEKTRQYYWHRFYASQPDLNFDNPRVQEEMLKIASFWLDMGIDGFRADAVPYLFEREGTNCENLPETHAYLKKLRAFMDKNYPGRILLCEANQWPEDVRPYFGDGDEFQIGFHFPIMPRIYMALKKGRRDDMVEILRRTPPIPENCQWCTFLRNHDELTLEMVTEEERQWMWKEYAPEPRMRLNLGIRRRLAPLLDNDRRKIELAHSLLFALPGSPILYYGDEIGMGDNISLPDRNGVRTPIQWNSEPYAGFSDAPLQSLYAPVINDDAYGPASTNVAVQRRDPDSLWNTIRQMIMIRKEHHAFSRGEFEWLDLKNNKIAGFQRTSEGETLVAIHNLSDSQQSIVLKTKESVKSLTDLLSRNVFVSINGELELDLAPYQYLWLK